MQILLWLRFFEKNSLDVTTIARNGRLCVWESSMELSDLLPEEETPNKKIKDKDENDDDDIDLTKGEERTSALQEKNNDNVSEEEAKSNAKLIYKLLARHYLRDLVKGQNITLTAAAYHKDTHILVTGFSNGSFFVHELPEVNLIHSLSISDNAISTLAINNTGDWLGIACQEKGQLLVWEWQSETYVMKQQGHSQAMSCLAYSHDAQYIVTGGEDGKVKLWNTQSGFCFVTFSEHTSAVTAVRFANNRKFLVSASLDGTVRAYDMTRYRNFRTFVSPKPVQFSSLALESTGEFVAAGGQDVFEIYLWSMKLGRLVEVLSGHEGPVVSLDFSPSLASTMLASVSWDKTLKIWDAVERGSSCESIHLESDGLFVTFNPDGNEVAVATLNGKITMFDVKTATQTSSIDGRIDLSSGRLETDLITAKKSLEGKGFNSLCYSADGQYILAGGQSKNICIYNVQESILVKKIEVTQNRSFDAVNDFIDRRKMTEFGNAALIEKREQLEGGNKTISLPGVKSGDMAARAIKPEIRIYSLQFSPTGQAWAAVSTEGLLIYSLDGANLFDPFQLDISITPDSIRQTLYQQEYSKALMMSLRLNEQFLVQEVVESVPPKNIELCVATLPDVYAEKVLKFLAVTLESTKHIEFYLLWIQNLITTKHRPPMTTLLALQKNLSMKYQDLSKICDFNKYTMDFLTDLGHLRSKPQKGNDTQEELLMEIDNS
uniref:Small-subunit processome Utp12 domain-containing protein n=1 Tax=Clastoptera arizonana TaxID=38151 RepID=A0A1B6D3H1_9HEMI